jgi:hypothetical protein
MQSSAHHSSEGLLTDQQEKRCIAALDIEQ